MPLKNVYRKIPREYAIHVNYARHVILKQYLKIFYLLKYGKSDMFNDLNIETTTACNRRCGYCPNSVYDRSLMVNENLMPEGLFKKIIDDLKSINFTGRISPHFYGEPLMDRRLVSLMEYTHHALPRSRIVIYTNGDLLDMITLKKLYEAGVKEYVVTLHADPEQEQNKKRILDLEEDIRQCGSAVRVKFLEINNKSLLSNRGGLVKIRNVSKYRHCQYATNPLVINYKGDVLLCCNDYLGTTAFGNVATSPLMDIWDREYFRSVRKDIRKKYFRYDICKKCNADKQ